MTDKNEMQNDVYRLANEHVWQDGDGQSTALGVRTRVRVENAFIAGYKAHKDHMQAQLDSVIAGIDDAVARSDWLDIMEQSTKLKEMRG